MNRIKKWLGNALTVLLLAVGLVLWIGLPWVVCWPWRCWWRCGCC